MTTQRQVSAEAYPTRRTIREAERRAQIAAREHEQLYVEQPAVETTVKSPGSSAEKARAEAVVAGAPVVDQDRPLTRRERRRSRSIDERLSSESDTIQSTPRSMEPETPLAGPSIKSSEPSVKPAERPTTFVPVAQWATERGQTPPTSRRSQRTHSSQGTHSAVLETKTTSKDASGRWMPRMAILGSLAAATTVIPLTGSPTSPATAGEVVHYEATDVLDVLMASSDYGTDVDAAVSLGADPLVGVRTAVSASRNSERTAPLCGNLAASANGSGAAEVASRPLEVVMPMSDGSYRITSRYGYRSLWGRYSQHAGVDLAAPAGTPIHAIADGVVEYTGAGKAGRSSMFIIVRHNINGQIVRSWYVHMYSSGVYVGPGQQIKAGDVIGAVGSNGNSTGPHLHLEIHLDSNLTTTDPLVWLANNSAAPLNTETRACLPG